jgi:Ca2+-binding RTX toxin-like protein
MSRITRALLGAAVAAVAIPASAGAATITVHDTDSAPPHAFSYEAAPGEANNLRYDEAADGSTIISDTAPLRIVGESSLDGCRFNGAGDVVCAARVRPADLDLGDGNDVVRYRITEANGRLDRGGGLDAGAGDDTIFAGVRINGDGVLNIDGGPGAADKVTYAEAERPADVSLDGNANDGVSGDVQNIVRGVEQIEGSSFGDQIDGSDANHREVFTGGPGTDIINGLGGTDVFREGPVPSGSDILNGGGGIDLVDYSQRTRALLIDHDAFFDDGQPGERDFVDPSVDDIFGGQSNDTITTGSGANIIRGFAGNDTIRTGAGNDTLDGGTGVDTLDGEDGDDTLDAVDNTADVLRCGIGADTLNRDLRDVDATGCETVNSVGTLALAASGSTVRLSWSHPVSWKQLRKVELKLRERRQIVGRIAIRPQADTIRDSGAVHLERARLSHRDKKVTARMKLRYDRALAGKVLRADVVAVDRRGVKQFERDAGTVRVAR